MLEQHQPYNQQQYDQSCQECRKVHHHHQKEMISSSQQDSIKHQQIRQRIIIPIHKHQLKTNNNNEYNQIKIQKIILELKNEIDQLKNNNLYKDKQIQELKKQLNSSINNNLIRQQLQKQSLNIQQVKQQFQNNKNYNQNLNKPILTQQYNFKNSRQPIYSQVCKVNQDNIWQPSNYINQQNRKITTKSVTIKGDNQLKQVIRQMQQHIEICQYQMLWMTNFILSFLKMIKKISQFYHDNVIQSTWGFKRKTKQGWRYTKHILHYLLGFHNIFQAQQ